MATTKVLFANNAATRLTSDVTASATTLSVTPNTTSLFPSPSSIGDYFMLCLVADNGSYELVKCTAKDETTFTVVRAQEGTTAKAFSTGTLIENRLTAGSLTTVLNNVAASTLELGTVRIATSSEVTSGQLAADGPAVCTPENIQDALQTVSTGAFIKGGIVAFSGTFGGTNNKYPIPTGSSTPDTHWRICDGTGNTPNLVNKFILGSNSAYNTTGGAFSHSGSVDAHQLTIEEMPSHTHGYSHRGGNGSVTGYGENGNPTTWWTTYTGGSQPHSHTYTIDTTPPYYRLAYIMKVA